MARTKKTAVAADEAKVEATAVEPVEKDAAADTEKKTEKKTAATNTGYEKGKTYNAKDVMPIYDKVGGVIVGTLYKFEAVVVTGVEVKNNRVYLAFDRGVVCASDDAHVYVK